MSNSRSHHPRRLLAAGVTAAVFAAGALGLAPTTKAATPVHAGLDTLLGAAPTGDVRGIATFDAVPTAAQTSALRALGLRVQPMEHLPLALVVGPVATLGDAVAKGLAKDVYPDEKLQLLDTASSDAMGSAALRAKGLTGKGVTVAVVDSGCDAAHADLADHVVHNVKIVGGEYANVRPDPTAPKDADYIAVPVEQSPYQNSDIGSGHGTHVAGIIAADGTTSPDHLGVAPDANLVCYSIGEVLFTTAVVSAYDHMLDQPDLWGIKVVNNSWGNSFRQYDPNDPVAVATKAVADRGVTVVFAAGNSGSDDAEASLNPFSQSPWVISVAAGSLDRHRADFSSNGLIYDNSVPGAIGEDGHTTYTGDRIGLYHPDVTAPGEDISSTCDPLGAVIIPCDDPTTDSNAPASGTSMASPHIAGAAAVLLQANPALTPDQIRRALEATATPVKGVVDTPTENDDLPFWEVGYGYVNLDAAVALVSGRDWSKRLDKASAAADQRVLAADGARVLRSDLWTYAAPPVTVGGSDSHTYDVAVGKGVTNLKVTLAHPSLGTVGPNGMQYTVTVKDASGKVLGTSTEAPSGTGTSSALVAVPGPGAYTVEVSGDYAGSDPDTIDSDSALGRVIVLQVAQLRMG
jgi:serine protease AprX